eukprot:2827109-Rhodomonas_salina.3
MAEEAQGGDQAMAEAASAQPEAVPNPGAEEELEIEVEVGAHGSQEGADGSAQPGGGADEEAAQSKAKADDAGKPVR